MYYHLSQSYTPERFGPLVPYIPADAEDHNDSDYETERICASPTIGQALAGVYAYHGHVWNVCAISEEPNVFVTSDVIYDTEETGEVWFTRPVMPTHIGTILTTAYYECGKCFSDNRSVHEIPLNKGYKWIPNVHDAHEANAAIWEAGRAHREASIARSIELYATEEAN